MGTSRHEPLPPPAGTDAPCNAVLVDETTGDGKRKFDLTACIRELLQHGIIELGRGQSDPKQLFLKRGKGLYVVQFFEGRYFRRPLAERTHAKLQKITDDPLYQPLRAIGVDEAGIRRVFKECSRGLIQRWIRVTDVAQHERPHGFPGFKTSPAAFFMDAVQNERMPPDWIYTHEKEQKRLQWDRDRQDMAQDEAAFRTRYQSERITALESYLSSPEGRSHYVAYYPTFLEFYRTVAPDCFRDSAHTAATGKVEREHFQFPDFGVWLLDQRSTPA